MLTWPDKRGGKWSPEQFFQTGRADVQDMLLHLGSLATQLNYGMALDFGCGVGRLTQALAEEGFQEVHGVDVAPTMIEEAEKFNRHPGECVFHLNLADDLRLFDDNTFDLVMSVITLQHLPKPYALKYIAEFVRVAKGDGLIVFQVPDSMMVRKQATTRRRMTASPTAGPTGAEPQMIMSGVPCAEVTRVLEECGAQLLEAVEDGYAGPEWLSYKYYAKKRTAATGVVITGKS